MNQISEEHAMKEIVVPFYVTSEGKKVSIQQVTATFYCNMYAWRFPFDSHEYYFDLIPLTHLDELLLLIDALGLF